MRINRRNDTLHNQKLLLSLSAHTIIKRWFSQNIIGKIYDNESSGWMDVFQTQFLNHNTEVHCLLL